MSQAGITMTSFLVVVPVLNQEAYVEEALHSILIQSSTVPLQVVVVDGGSSDRTMEAVERAFSSPHRAKVSVISEPDEGQSDAITKGIALGTGEIVGWLNADDRLIPGALARVAPRLFEQSDVVAVYGDTRYIDETGNALFDLR